MPETGTETGIERPEGPEPVSAGAERQDTGETRDRAERQARGGLTTYQRADECYAELRGSWARGMVTLLERMLGDVRRGAAQDILDDSALVNDTLVEDFGHIKAEMARRAGFVAEIRAHCGRHRRGGEV